MNQQPDKPFAAAAPLSAHTAAAERAPVVSHNRRWRSTELFGKDQEIEIEHGQAIYRLRLTSLGKLILTK